jgi:hypothetical protein
MPRLEGLLLPIETRLRRRRRRTASSGLQHQYSSRVGEGAVEAMKRMSATFRAITYSTLFVGLLLIHLPARALSWSGIAVSGPGEQSHDF